MEKILSTLSAYPTATRLELTGTLIVARDSAHAKLQERIDRGEGLPQYAKVRCHARRAHYRRTLPSLTLCT
jgi:fumarate hydratase class I